MAHRRAADADGAWVREAATAYAAKRAARAAGAGAAAPAGREERVDA
jgi:ring-1,2-phenylacetyl-CoA epoxidase subunit PaaA